MEVPQMLDCVENNVLIPLDENTRHFIATIDVDLSR